MSNHSGSYMLNEVLLLLEKNNFFEYMGKEKTHSFLKEIFKISYHYDCNDSEILDDIGERLGICYSCKKSVTVDSSGLCKACAADLASYK